MSETLQLRHPDLVVQLSGTDGNAFAVLGRVQEALRDHLTDAGWDREDIDAEVSEFHREATAGDYDYLLQSVMRWVDVQ